MSCSNMDLVSHTYETIVRPSRPFLLISGDVLPIVKTFTEVGKCSDSEYSTHSTIFGRFL